MIFARVSMQIVPPKKTMMIILESYFRRGGSAAKQALAKAPSTQTTKITKRMVVRMRALSTDFIRLPMKSSWRFGKAASAPAKTVAVAKKKERLLNTQNALTVAWFFTAAYDSGV
jgi:hypothetical protein